VGFIERILQGGEKEILEKLNQMADIGIEASKFIDELILKGGTIEKIKDLEKRSDNVAFEITNMITSGGIAPNLIDNLLELVNKEDNIIDSMYNLARELLRYNIHNKELDKYVKERLLKMNSFAKEALSTMKKMHVSDRLSEIRKFRRKIEELEEEGDEIKDGLFDIAYIKKIDYKTFYHIIELAHKADDMLDNCEDSSDIFLTVMSSIVS
jgi:uncharacterized protein Yka (UPF0111/DUF47 family)